QEHVHSPRMRARIPSPWHGPAGVRESGDSGRGDAGPACCRIWTNKSDEQYTVQLRLRARVRLAVSGRRTGNRRRGVRGTPPTHPVTAAPTTIASADRPGGIT